MTELHQDISQLANKPSPIEAVVNTTRLPSLYLLLSVLGVTILSGYISGSDPTSIRLYNLLAAILAFVVFVYLCFYSAHKLRLKNWQEFISKNNLAEVLPEFGSKFAPPGVLHLSMLSAKDSLLTRLRRLLLSFTMLADYKQSLMSYYSLVWHKTSPVVSLGGNGSVAIYEGRLKAQSFVKDSFTTKRVFILSAKLPNSFSPVILDGLKSRFAISPPKDYIRYSLEGNFSKRFSLWFKKGSQIEALSLITPDVMGAIDKMGQSFDVEVYGDQLFIYTSDLSPQNLNALVKSYSIIMPEIVHKSNSAKPAPQPNYYNLGNGYYIKNSDRYSGGALAPIILNLLSLFLTFTVIGMIAFGFLYLYNLFVING